MWGTETNFMVFKPWGKKTVLWISSCYERAAYPSCLGNYVSGCSSSLIATKMSKSIGIIHKSRFLLSPHSLRTLYNSMILPHMYYCNLAWGCSYKSNLKRIVILQKRALRIVSKSRYDGVIAHTDPIFKEQKLLKSNVKISTCLY